MLLFLVVILAFTLSVRCQLFQPHNDENVSMNVFSPTDKNGAISLDLSIYNQDDEFYINVLTAEGDYICDGYFSRAQLDRIRCNYDRSILKNGDNAFHVTIYSKDTKEIILETVSHFFYTGSVGTPEHPVAVFLSEHKNKLAFLGAVIISRLAIGHYLNRGVVIKEVYEQPKITYPKPRPRLTHIPDIMTPPQPSKKVMQSFQTKSFWPAIGLIGVGVMTALGRPKSSAIGTSMIEPKDSASATATDNNDFNPRPPAAPTVTKESKKDKLKNIWRSLVVLGVQLVLLSARKIRAGRLSKVAQHLGSYDSFIPFQN